MIVLGIHEGHDSSAAILKDGEILADVQEERFCRVKHSNNTPINSILYCLKEAGLESITDVDRISLSWSNTPTRLAKLLGLKSKDNPLAKTVAKHVFGFTPSSEKTMLPIYLPDFTKFPDSNVVNNDHHLTHAASAYFTRKSNSPCLIFCIDGAGDKTCTSVWKGQGSEISLLKRYYNEASIGWAYSAVTEAIHWIHGDGEGKTMGLAPYGNPEKCKGLLDDYFPVFTGNKLTKKSEIGFAGYWSESGSIQFHLEEAKAIEKLVEKYGREDIAAEAQRKLEECVRELVYGWIDETGIHNTAFAGGVMLNVKLNQRIWNNRGEKIHEQHIYPNPGDSGLAVGAALLEYYRHNEFKGKPLEHLYSGPSFSNIEIEEMLKIRKLKYKKLDNPSVFAAELLAEDKIVAWFQGRMESGPRALGNRSILMSPLKSENKEIINAWVKFREGFRPFCPSLLWEKSGEYLKDFRDEFFMITSFDVEDSKKDKVPAVVHVDGTLRPQMVQKETNPRYWELINHFGLLTGEYILLNTSFNVMGEPIVLHPKEAIKCFFDSGMDALIIGDFCLTKE